jgi:hypothetical protein
MDCSSEESSDEYRVDPVLARNNSQTAINEALLAFNNATDANGSQDKVNSANIFRISEDPLQVNPLFGVVARFIGAGTPVGSADFPWNVTESYADRTLEVGSIGVQLRYSSFTTLGQDESVCSAVTHRKVCLLTPAIIDYSLEITNITKTDAEKADVPDANNGIFLVDNPDADFQNPAYANYEHEPVFGQFAGYSVNSSTYLPYDKKKYDGNLRHIAAWLESSFGSVVLMEYMDTEAHRGYAPNINAMENSVQGTSPLFSSYWIAYDPSEKCKVHVDTPIDYIGFHLNSLMVLSSMRAATDWKQDSTNYSTPQLEHIQPRDLGQWIPSIRYETNWAYGGAAIGIMALCILCVLPSYFGFWQLGRTVTLGPIEVAGAFQAPVMDHPAVATHGEVDEFVKEIGQRQVRYGLVSGERLAVASPQEVQRLDT